MVAEPFLSIRSPFSHLWGIACVEAGEICAQKRAADRSNTFDTNNQIGHARIHAVILLVSAAW